jgi:hypothetical protein
MNTFTFEGKQKTFLLWFMVLGLFCLALTYFTDSQPLHVRFWTNFLHNTVFFTGISFISLFIIAVFTIAWAGWHTGMKRVWEAFAGFMIPGLVLFAIIIIGLWGNLHHLYHWADTEAVKSDPVLLGKSSFLNKYWYTLGTLVIVGGWIFFANRLRQLSLDEDENGLGLADDFRHHRAMRAWSAGFMPFAGFSSAAVIWQWVMSVDAHWYSTLFAWYSGASWFVAAMALTILVLIYLKSIGYYENITMDHFHDMGKFVFAISVFWTYLWFSQYMLIWYGNVGEETIYFRQRLDNYPALFFGNLIINFAMPFFILMRNDNKRKFGPLAVASVLVFIGHWLDYFLMIKPGARLTALEAAAHHGGGVHEEIGKYLGFAGGFTIPGLLEFGTMLGFLALFIYSAFTNLEKAALVPKNDPYLEEASHHHVWPFID